MPRLTATTNFVPYTGQTTYKNYFKELLHDYKYPLIPR